MLELDNITNYDLHTQAKLMQQMYTRLSSVSTTKILNEGSTTHNCSLCMFYSKKRWYSQGKCAFILHLNKSVGSSHICFNFTEFK